MRLAGWTVADSNHKSNKGISPRMKLALQIGFAALLFCLWLAQINRLRITTIPLPFGLLFP